MERTPEAQWVLATWIGIVATIFARCGLTPDLCQHTPTFSRLLDYGALYILVIIGGIVCGYVRVTLDLTHFYHNRHDQLRLWLRLSACVAATGVLFFDVLRFEVIHRYCALDLLLILLVDEGRIATAGGGEWAVLHLVGNTILFATFILTGNGWFEIAGILSVVGFFIHERKRGDSLEIPIISPRGAWAKP